ncbi:MAG TPA: hypothetical protein VFX15_01810 [Actinomycetes bacterium]|nr:hypothetical protein [Actinomycetes bacterium]
MTDPADRVDRSLAAQMDQAGIPPEERAHNAGGTMSETQRSRTADLDDADEGAGHSSEFDGENQRVTDRHPNVQSEGDDDD